MNLRDLHYFKAVAELKHFGKAAALCHVSQPTLSMQLKKLEDTLGAPLFERTNRSVRLTAFGEQALQKARDVLQAAEALEQLATLASDPLAGELRLGVFPTLAPYLLPLIMPALAKRFDRLVLRLVEEKTDSLLAALEEGRIDAALLALPVAQASLQSALLFEEPFTLAVPHSHPLARHRKITLAQLEPYPLLLLDEGHCLREQALSVCQRIGVRESQSFRATSLETLRHMVAAGHAITLMPKLAVEPDNEHVRYLPFAAPAPSRSIALCWRKTSHRTTLMTLMAETIKKAVK